MSRQAAPLKITRKKISAVLAQINATSWAKRFAASLAFLTVGILSHGRYIAGQATMTNQHHSHSATFGFQLPASRNSPGSAGEGADCQAR